MKTLIYSGLSATVLFLSPVAAYANCDTNCWRYCGYKYEGNEPAYEICYDGCMAGCTEPGGPTMPTVP